MHRERSLEGHAAAYRSGREPADGLAGIAAIPSASGTSNLWTSPLPPAVLDEVPPGIVDPSLQLPALDDSALIPTAFDSVLSTPAFARDGGSSLWDWVDPAGYELPDSFFLDLPTTVDGWSLDPMNPIQPPVATISRAGPELTIPPDTTTNQPDRQTRWFSFDKLPSQLTEPASSGDTSTSTSNPSNDLSDRHRASAQRELLDLPLNPSLPPTSFLNKCLRLVTSRFLSILPLLHLPSFRPSSCSTWLLVGMFCIGSELVATPSAAVHGDKIFQSLVRAVLSTWQLPKRGMLATMQGVVLGLLYAMLSGQSRHLITSQAFLGTVVFGYQRAQKRVRQSAEGSSEREALAQLERIGQALCILDAELALLCNRPPVLRAKDRVLSGMVSDEEYYLPEQCAAVSYYRGEGGEARSRDDTGVRGQDSGGRWTLWDYAELSNVLAGIAERNYYPDTADDVLYHEEKLADWLHTRSQTLPSNHDSPLHLLMLWHSGWLSLLSPLDTLELAHGRDGPTEALSATQNAITWTTSTNSLRALLHAAAIHRILASISLSAIVAIHVPRCAYHAGLVLYSLASFASCDRVPSEGARGLEGCRDVQAMREVGMLLGDSDWGWLDRKYGNREKLEEQAAVLAGLLGRVGPWGLGRKLGGTLEMVMGE